MPVLAQIARQSFMVSFVIAAESLHAHYGLTCPGTCKDGRHGNWEHRK